MKTVSATLKENYITEIEMDDHALIADEPENSGGDNRGPNPYDLLLASLAACTVMTIRWYADRKKLDLKGCRVRLEYDRIHIQDCQSCAENDPRSMVDHIKREVTLIGNFPDEERERLLSIPGKCPVSKTLKSGVIIDDVVSFE